MAKEKLIIAYDGEALQDHEMDIDELAFALTGLSDIFKYTCLAVNQKEAKISLKIKTLEAGSFEIHTILSYINDGFKLFNSESAIGLKNILEVLGFIGGAGLIQFIRTIKNNPIVETKEIDKNVEVTYKENSENKTTIVNRNVFVLFNNGNVTNSFPKLLKPLENEGINSFETRDKNKNILTRITKEEAKYYNIKSSNIEENEIFEADMWLTPISITFKEGYKWKFANDYNEFYANIIDDEFMQKINTNQIQFSKGDTLKAHIKIEKISSKNNVKNEYTIVKVLEYKSIQQLNMDFPD